jgi:hypothetical protein
MKDLCSRARAVMNLLLIVFLLELWVLAPSDSDGSTIELELSSVSSLLTYIDSSDIPAAKAFNAVYDAENELFKLDTPVHLVMDIDGQEISKKFYRDLDANLQRDLDKIKSGKKVDANSYDAISKGMDALGQLKDLARAASLATDNAATFRDVSHKLAQRMEAPYVKANLSPESLSTVLIGADLAAVSVLFVLFQSMWLTLLKSPESANLEVFDTILLYRSKWGAFIGGLWVLVPTMLTMYLFPKDPEYFASAIALLFVVGVFVRTRNIRNKLYSNSGSISAPRASVTATSAAEVVTPAAATSPPSVVVSAAAPAASINPVAPVVPPVTPPAPTPVRAIHSSSASTPSDKEVKGAGENEDEEDAEEGDGR